jgi:hypothetical protein
MRISLVSAPSLDSSGSVVRHTNSSRTTTSAVAFAGHSMAATSIFTPVFLMLNSFMLTKVLDGVTRVPACMRTIRKLGTKDVLRLVSKPIK